MTAPAPRVRPMRDEDLDEVVRLRLRLIDQEARFTASPALILAPDARDVLAYDTANAVASGRAVVFVVDAHAGGLAAFALVNEENRPPWFEVRRSAWVESVWVEPSLRGRGVGAALSAAALEWARSRGLAHVALSATTANAAGRAFWEREGYRETGVFLERAVD